MKKYEDKFHLERIKNDDSKALEQLFLKYYYPLCRFAKSFVKSSDMANEVVSDIFLNIWQNRKKLQITSSFKAYVYIAIKNQSLKVLNKNQFVFDELEPLHQHQERSYYTAESSMSYLELENELNAIIEELPPQRKAIFRLNRLEGLKYTEIADVLQISVSTVQKQMGEAIKYVSQYSSQFLTPGIFLFFTAIRNLL